MSPTAIVQWYQPGLSRQATGRTGRKKEVIDVFGPWSPVDQLPLNKVLAMPSPLVNAADVLDWGFELEAPALIPFDVLDRLMDEHGVDVTGFTYSMTPRGNSYRAHRHMAAVR